MKGEIWRHTHKGKMRCEDESRDEGDAAEAKGHQRLPANHQKLGRGKEGFSPRPFRRSMFLLTPCFQTSVLQIVGNQFLLFGAIKFVIICNGRTRATGANTVFQR